ncbi:MAG: hypothetical protein AB2591_04005 [Candidatus Thiodiazotropha sp.]
MKGHRKTYVVVAITSVLLVAGWLIGSEQLSGLSLCSNQIASELASPDKKHLAVVFERSCGATTGFSTQVSVLKEKNEFKNEAGNILIAEGHPNTTGIELAWLNENVLLVKGAEGAQFFLKSKGLGSIEVRYAP